MTQLSCQNKFCIYQKQGNCILENIQLDIQGSCEVCIYINIEEETLKKQKENLLKDF